jgi:flagellar basal body-associated protein FliL
MDTITIFLAIALIIIAVAFLLSWMFRKSIKRDKQIEKLHERHDDELGSGVGTGIGIDKVDGEY